MKKAKPYIAIATLLYVFQLICKFNHLGSPSWFSSYFSDFLCLPLLLSYTLLLIRKIKKLPYFILDWKMIVFALIYVSVAFEFVLPKYSGKFTADVFDVLMYILGSITFYFFQFHLLRTQNE